MFSASTMSMNVFWTWPNNLHHFFVHIRLVGYTILLFLRQRRRVILYFPVEYLKKKKKEKIILKIANKKQDRHIRHWKKFNYDKNSIYKKRLSKIEKA